MKIDVKIQKVLQQNITLSVHFWILDIYIFFFCNFLQTDLFLFQLICTGQIFRKLFKRPMYTFYLHFSYTIKYLLKILQTPKCFTPVDRAVNNLSLSFHQLIFLS